MTPTQSHVDRPARQQKVGARQLQQGLEAAGGTGRRPLAEGRVRSKGWQQAAGIGVRSRRGKEGSSKGGSGAFPRRRGADPACSRARLGLWWAAGGPSGGRQVGLGGHPELAHAGPSGGGRLGPGTLGSERGILAPSFSPENRAMGVAATKRFSRFFGTKFLPPPLTHRQAVRRAGGAIMSDRN